MFKRSQQKIKLYGGMMTVRQDNKLIILPAWIGGHNQKEARALLMEQCLSQFRRIDGYTDHQVGVSAQIPDEVIKAVANQ